MKHIKLNDTCHIIVIDDKSSIVIGSPPEWIKLVKDIPFPQHVFIGETILHDGYNFSEVEFPIYKNFFFNNLRKTIIVSPGKNISRLKAICQETLLGPFHHTRNRITEKAEFYANSLAVRKNFNPNERKLELDDYAEFLPYENGVYKAAGVSISLKGSDTFNVKSHGSEINITLSYRNNVPASKKNHTLDGKLSLYCFDSGNGFSPNKACSSFLLNIDQHFLVFDPNIYSFDTMKKKGLDLKKIKAIFISHIHADHDQGLFRFLHHNVDYPIITLDSVYPSIYTKIENMYKKKDFLKRIKILTLNNLEKTAMDFLGVDMIADNGFHSIPSAMIKIYFRGRPYNNIVFGYSGDTMFDPGKLESAEFKPEYRDQLYRFFDDVNILVYDAGAGLIHTDPEDLIPYLRKGQKVFWTHTQKTNDDGFSAGYILKCGENIVCV